MGRWVEGPTRSEGREEKTGQGKKGHRDIGPRLGNEALQGRRETKRRGVCVKVKSSLAEKVEWQLEGESVCLLADNQLEVSGTKLSLSGQSEVPSDSDESLVVTSFMDSMGQFGHQNHFWQLLSCSDILRQQSEFNGRRAEVVSGA